MTREELESIRQESYELPNNVLTAVPFPIVSVRTSTYNHGAYIRDCIEGVLSQKTDLPVEYIIGEDCSTDGTREVVFAYAQKYPDIIRVITADRNVGMKANGYRTRSACRGMYVAICEGDDYWTDPLKLQKQVDFLEAYPEYSLCFHNVSMKYEDGSREQHQAYRPKGMKSTITLEDVLWSPLLITCSVMFHNGLLREYPDWFFEAPFGDWPIFVFLAQRGDLGYLDEVMAVYRVHSGGMYSGADQITRLQQRLWFLERMREYLGAEYSDILEQLILMCNIDIEMVKHSMKLTDGAVQNRVASARARLQTESKADRVEQLWTKWYVARAFTAHDVGDLASARGAILAALRSDWRVLRNRGLVSIAFRAFAGQAAWGAARSMSRRLRAGGPRSGLENKGLHSRVDP